MIKVSEVATPKDRKDFLILPWKIYNDYPQWVPPLRHDMNAIIRGKGTTPFSNGSHAFFIAREDGQVVGRIAVGIDEKVNRTKGVEHSFFTLLESLDSDQIGRALLDTAASWGRRRGMKLVKGPVSPTNGDDYRGLLVDNFEDPPAVLMPYNPPYYCRFFEDYHIYLKYLAFKYDLSRVFTDRETKLIEIAMKRYGFTLEDADFKDLERTAKDIHKVTVEAMPDWEEDVIPPTFEEIYQAAKTLKVVADRRMVIIARSGDRPIGYFVAFPDFSPIIRRIDGRLFPFGWYTFLRQRNTIERVRAAILFVIPEFRNKGVPTAMFARAYNNMRHMGYRTMEGSSISWMNTTMIANAKRAGGEQYKSYIVYGKSLLKRPLTLDEIYGKSASKMRQAAGELPLAHSAEPADR